MGTIKISKLGVAINQLEMAIDLFLKNKDLICVITLAGAAEEILGRYAVKSNEQPMIDLLCSSLKEEHSIDMIDKDFKKEYLNKARNTVKHFDNKENEIIELDPSAEAKTMLVRAIGNLYSHDKTVTHNTPVFLKKLYSSSNQS